MPHESFPGNIHEGVPSFFGFGFVFVLLMFLVSSMISLQFIVQYLFVLGYRGVSRRVLLFSVLFAFHFNAVSSLSLPNTVQSFLIPPHPQVN